MNHQSTPVSVTSQEEFKRISQLLARFTAEHVGVNPTWEPLEAVLPLPMCSGFMFMGHSTTWNNKPICLYKHGITRRYLNLDAKGQAYKYTGHGGYTTIGLEEAIEHAFQGVEDMGHSRTTPYNSEFRAVRDAALAAAGFTVVSGWETVGGDAA